MQSTPEMLWIVTGVDGFPVVTLGKPLSQDLASWLLGCERASAVSLQGPVKGDFSRMPTV